MRKRPNYHRLGAWLGALALLIQVLVPFIVALELQALGADPGEHTHHLAVVDHLQAQHGVLQDGGQPPGGAGHDGHSHADCPLCLALHVADAVAAAAPGTAELPPPSRNCMATCSFVPAARKPACPASYLSRAPPPLA
jgi:hypothetical protein